MPDLPSGTVTFLFTDIEGSTRLWGRNRPAMHAAVERHFDLLRGVVEAHRGVLYKMVGDGTQSAFPASGDALAAALAAQRALLATSWPDPPGPLRVRMALHVGEASPQAGDYLAAPLNRLARLLASGHGSQILSTQTVQQLVRDDLPVDVVLHELGAHHLRDLQEPEVVFQVVAPGLPATFPSLRTLPRHPTNLPVPPSRLIGRQTEIAAVLRLFEAEARLVTLTGPGGTGKTRLAQEIATEAQERFPDGVFFVDLSPLRDATDVLPTMASVLGVRETAGESLRDALGRYLSGRRLLLVLDNCEQVLPAAADLAALLATSPQVTLLATSREPLRLRMEQIFPVPPLPLPDSQRLPDLAALAAIPSVALFVERAQAADPDFTLAVDNARTIAAICRRLDGLPLAIELAAARVRHLSPTALLARLEGALPVLTGGPRDAPERQRTLRQAIAWSYDLLEPVEQTLFRGLAVFVGGWTLPAAETMASAGGHVDAFEGLSSLADKSLILIDASTPEPRYRMLETIREYALEQLLASPDEEWVRRAHAIAMFRLVRENDPDESITILPSATEEWLARLAVEEANVRAAIEWAIIDDPETALDVSTRLGQFWFAQGRPATGLDLYDRILATGAGENAPTRAVALIEAAQLATGLGELARAEAFADAAFTLAERLGVERPAAWARLCQGTIAVLRGKGEQAALLLQDALARFEALGDESAATACLTELGINAMKQGDAASAVAFFERCLHFDDLRQDLRGRAIDLGNLAEAHRYLGHHELAQSLSTQTLALAEQIESPYVKAAALALLGRLAMDRREIAHAAELIAESLGLWWEIGDKSNVAEVLETAAAIMVAGDHAEAGARLYGVAETLREAISAPVHAAQRADNERDLAALRAALDEPTVIREREQGRRQPLADAVAEALLVLASIAEMHPVTDVTASFAANRIFAD